MDSSILMVEEATMAGEIATEGREATASSLNSTVFAVNNKIVTVVAGATAVEAAVDTVTVETIQIQSLWEILATATNKELNRY